MNTLMPVVLTSLIMLIVCGCEQRIRPSVVDGLAVDEMPAQESWNSIIILSKDGAVSAVIHAGYMAIYSDRKRTDLEDGVHVDFLNNDGDITSILTSDRAEVDEVLRDLSAFGNVIVESSDGTVLKTEELHYEDAAGRVHTDKFVEIISPDEVIFGYGLESDAGLENYTIFRVTGRTRPDSQ
jgi:LPS export ABC transporter protein LptC